MPALDIKDAISIVTGLATIAGVIFALRAAVTRLEGGQTEVLRQIAALHKRIDDHAQRFEDMGEQINAGKVSHAVLAERVEFLRGSGARVERRVSRTDGEVG